MTTSLTSVPCRHCGAAIPIGLTDNGFHKQLARFTHETQCPSNPRRTAAAMNRAGRPEKPRVKDAWGEKQESAAFPPDTVLCLSCSMMNSRPCEPIPICVLRGHALTTYAVWDAHQAGGWHDFRHLTSDPQVSGLRVGMGGRLPKHSQGDMGISGDDGRH